LALAIFWFLEQNSAVVDIQRPPKCTTSLVHTQTVDVGIISTMAYRVIDLFAGAGGLTEGFREAFGASLLPVWANDNDPAAVLTYNENFGPHCIHGDITDLLADPKTCIPQADLVIGGPPCQGFSLLNKNREADPRKAMWIPIMDVLKQIQSIITTHSKGNTHGRCSRDHAAHAIC